MEDKVEVLDEEKKEVKEEVKVETPKKKSPIGWIILVIILMGGCLVGGYFINESGILSSKEEPTKKEDKKKEKKEEKEEKLSLEDGKFINIYNELKSYTYNKNRENGYKGFSDVELSTIAIDKLVEGDLTKTGEKDEWGRPYYTFSSNKLVEYLKESFGKDVTFNFSSIVNKEHGYETKISFGEGSGMSIISYDDSTKNYKVRFFGLGGTTPPKATVVERKITSAVLKGDTITVEEKAIYYKNDVDLTSNKSVYNIYSDSAMSNTIDTKNYDLDKVDKETISVESYMDKASTITSTYKLDKDSNKYYFVSSSVK